MRWRACHDVNLAGYAAAASEVEQQALRWLGEFVGYPGGRRRLHERRHGQQPHGARGRARARAAGRRAATAWTGARGAVYCSAEAHHSVLRAAELLGIGARGVRALPIDGTAACDPATLAAAIDADRAARRSCRSRWSRPPARR